MKKILIPALMVCLVSLYSCLEDECTTTITYMAYEAVYKTKDEFKEDIQYVAERPLENPGKFYYYGSLILISEVDVGVHIIDNSNVSKPEQVGFITIPGNQDISLTDHYLYADTKYNIAVIDIEDITQPQVVTFIENVKDIYFFEADEGRLIVDYVLANQVQEVSCDEQTGPVFWSPDRRLIFIDVALDAVSSAGVPEFSNDGIAGSLSRMALFNDHFYYINSHQMHVFDVEDPANPMSLNEIYLDWGIETIFPYEDKLFIGANNGMHIFDNSDPANPVYLSTFAHANACDPVAVEGDIAYITLRDGNECQNFINQLDVVDVSDLLKPELIASYPMHHPHGLSVRNNVLYLCEADEGLKVFDVTDPETVSRNQLAHVKDYYALDVIAVSRSLLLMIGQDGFYQFDTSEPSDPKLLSSISTGQ